MALPAILTAALLTLPACTNRLRGGRSQTALNTVTGVFGTGGTGITSFLTLSKVVPSTSAPTQFLDLVGDATNTIGKFCIDSAGQTLGAGFGESTCECVFTYNDGANILETPTSYHESNLIRCDYSQVPVEQQVFEVKIHVLTADVYSNEISFNRAAAGVDSADVLDLSSAVSYIEARKYQCRDMLTAPYLWDTQGNTSSTVKIYDPFQSERPALNYPLNFYAGNPGMSILNLVAASQQEADFYKNWDCSFDPINVAPWENHVVYSELPLPYDPAIPGEADEGFDLELYGFTDDYLTYYKETLNPEVGGSGVGRVDNLIFHPDPKVRLPRSTFLLARKKTGVFSVPVNAAVGPGQGLISFSDADPSDPFSPAPIGFGARPNFSQPGEPCPGEDQVTIPEGYHWVKVWAFQGDLDARVGVQSARAIIRNPRISCDPGNFETAPKTFGSTEALVRSPAFRDCRDPDIPRNFSGGDITGTSSANPSDITDTTPDPPPKLRAVNPFRLQDAGFEEDRDILDEVQVPTPNFACNTERLPTTGGAANDGVANWECTVPRGPDGDPSSDPGFGKADAALAARVIEFFGGNDQLCVRFPRLDVDADHPGDTDWQGGTVGGGACEGVLTAEFLSDAEKKALADASSGASEEGPAQAGQARLKNSACEDVYPGMDLWVRDGSTGVSTANGDGFQDPHVDTGSLPLGTPVKGDPTWESDTTNYFQFVDGIGGGLPQVEAESGEDRTGWNLKLDMLRIAGATLLPGVLFPAEGRVPLQTADFPLDGTEEDPSTGAGGAFITYNFESEARPDFLFVVSPEKDPEPGSIRFLRDTFLGQDDPDLYGPYKPFRFTHNEVCLVNTNNGLTVIEGTLRIHHDPENGVGTDCTNSDAQRTYLGPFEHGIGSSDNADPGNPEGRVYPICAIQPDDLRTLYDPGVD